MSFEDRISDALDAAAAVHDRPADLMAGIDAGIVAARARRRRRIAAGASLGAAAAVLAFVVLVSRPPDRREVHLRPATTTTTTAVDGSTTTAASVVAPPTSIAVNAPPTFAGVVEDGRLVVADAETGRVTRTLYRPADGTFVSAPAMSGDGRTVYFATTAGQQGVVWRVALAGGKPERVADGCGVAVSKEGERLAMVGTSSGCREGITVLDASTRRTVATFPDGGFAPHVFSVEWDLGGRWLLFEAADEEMPSRIYRLDVERHRTLADAELVGPRGDVAESWSSLEVVPHGESTYAIEYCCMVDAEPPDSDVSSILRIDSASGAVLDRRVTPEDITDVAVSMTGKARLFVGNRRQLYREDVNGWRRLEGTWIFVDW